MSAQSTNCIAWHSQTLTCFLMNLTNPGHTARQKRNAPMPRQSLLFHSEKVVYNKKEDVFRMVSLNCRDLGMDCSFELTGTNEREIMRKFIDYAETELKMPVLTADTIYRVQMAIKK
jgi:predicted small metal-binding protein